MIERDQTEMIRIETYRGTTGNPPRVFMDVIEDEEKSTLAYVEDRMCWWREEEGDRAVESNEVAALMLDAARRELNEPAARELSHIAADKALELESKNRRQRLWDDTYASTFSALAADAFLKANSPEVFVSDMQRNTVRNLIGNAAVATAQASCDYYDDLQETLAKELAKREAAR